jgi:hypothetical protein
MIPQPTTFSTAGYDAQYEIAVIDDLICDLYSGQHGWLYSPEVSPLAREAMKRDLGVIIDRLRAWREGNGWNAI